MNRVEGMWQVNFVIRHGQLSKMQLAETIFAADPVASEHEYAKMFPKVGSQEEEQVRQRI